jgi:FtsZ-interacting cell division protein ZipA
MSDLQTALLLVGLLVVGGVYLFNVWQQRRIRRHSEQAFGNQHDDVLLRAGGEAAPERRPEPRVDARVEPRIGPVATEEAGATETEVDSAPPAAGRREADEDFHVDFIAELMPSAPVGADSLAPLTKRRAEFGKPVAVIGLVADRGEWDEVMPGAPAHYLRVRASLQLCDRSGPVSEVMLSGFRDTVLSLARELDAAVNIPDTGDAAVQAALLDQFCAEVDQMIGVNLVARDDRPFPGTKVRALAESNGLRLAPDGRFVQYDAAGREQFSASDFDGRPLRAEALGQTQLKGLTFLLDLPRVADGDAAFDQMMHLARTFAVTLGAALVDDNRVALTDAGLARIREQIRRLQESMRSHDIAPGSPAALRLFS